MPEDRFPLDSTRSRSLLYASYAVWSATAAIALFATSAYISAAMSWLGTVERFRSYLGFVPSVNSPDWWLVSATLLAMMLPLGLATGFLVMHRRVWRRKLSAIWGESGGGRAERIRKPQAIADTGEIQRRCEDLGSLVATERWRSRGIEAPEVNADSYRSAAELVLADVERDIAQRAFTLGLVVGLSQKNWIDFLAISAAAVELQVHVLTSLGKRPSLHTWRQLWKRAASSLFFSWYLNAEQSLAFRLMIRKIGLGLEIGSQALEHAGSALLDSHTGVDDVDWDDVEHLLPEHVLGIPLRPVATAASITAGTLISVGSFGMNQIGYLIERRGDDLFQGALAATILYEHGVAVAADCIALDARHHESALLRPRFNDVMTRMSCQAGEMLQVQVRNLRGVLRERRRLIAKIAKKKGATAADSLASAVTGAVGNAATATSTAWGKAKDATSALVDAAGSGVRGLSRRSHNEGITSSSPEARPGNPDPE